MILKIIYRSGIVFIVSPLLKYRRYLPPSQQWRQCRVIVKDKRRDFFITVTKNEIQIIVSKIKTCAIYSFFFLRKNVFIYLLQKMNLIRKHLYFLQFYRIRELAGKTLL